LKLPGARMSKAPTVSVVMPAYNAAKYIKCAIESILRQTFNDFEFIIIEDCSTDNTQSIIREYAAEDSRIILCSNSRNLGIAPSLNRGLSIAHGEYVARMDADDISYPQRLEKQVAYLKTNPDVCMVATSFERIDENGDIIGPIVLNIGKDELKRKMKTENCVSHGSVVFRREEVMRLGNYREKCLHNEDYDLWLRLVEKHEISQIPDILYKFRISSQSISSAYAVEMAYYRGLIRQFAEERRLYGKDSYEKLPKAHAFATITSESERLASLHLQRGLAFLSSDMKRKARAEFSICIKMRPLRVWYWLLLIASLIPTPVLNIARWFWRKSPRDIH
jgi:glycosyltransferase involved in cell wall biosynthesis